jgi:exonuclease III
MRFLIWNIRCLNKPLKQHEVKKCIRRYNVSIICLVETRVKVDKGDTIKDFICPSWPMIHNYMSHPLGRAWI